MILRLSSAACPALIVATQVLPAAAQSYPAKPIRVIATSTAGDPLDVFARLVSETMAEHLRQPLVLERRAGAG